MSAATAPRRKILHVITTVGTGGAEMMLHKLLAGGAADAHASAVVSLRGHGPIGARIAQSGVPVYPLGMAPGRPSPARILALCRLVRRLAPDLIVGWMYHPMLLTCLARAAAGAAAPLVWNVRQTLYDIRDEKRSSAAVIRACRLLSGLPAATIYNSHLSKTQHIAFGFAARRAVVIPNGFDATLFRPRAEARAWLRAALGVGAATLLVGIVGRFHPQKDHGTFLAAAAVVAQRHPEARFVLVGAEVALANPFFAERVRALGLGERVFLLGERSDIAELTAALDVAVSSSAFNEAFPNVVGEAMACAVPTVATEVGDVRAILADGGTVVPPRDPAALAAAICAMLEAGPERRRAIGARARARLIERFSLAGVTRDYVRLFDDLLAGGVG